jgi:hypothetical protein
MNVEGLLQIFRNIALRLRVLFENCLSGIVLLVPVCYALLLLGIIVWMILMLALFAIEAIVRHLIIPVTMAGWNLFLKLLKCPYPLKCALLIGVVIYFIRLLIRYRRTKSQG